MDVNRVLVVAPHGDDEVIGCGGSVARLAKRGAQVTVVVVTERERSAAERADPAERFEAESRRAADVLGIGEVVHLGVPDRDVRSDRALLTALVGAIRRTRPDAGFLPHPGERDEVHAAVSAAALQAVWMAASPYFPEQGEAVAPADLVLGYEVWTPIAEPAFVQDISDVLAQKVEAMRAYESQTAVTDFPAAIQGLAAYRGAMLGGTAFAEAFSVHQLHFPSWD